MLYTFPTPAIQFLHVHKTLCEENNHKNEKAHTRCLIKETEFAQ